MREALKGDDADAIQKAHDKLMENAQTIGKIIYEEAARQQEAAAAEPQDGSDASAAADTAKKDDNVIDAEFEVKDAM